MTDTWQRVGIIIPETNTTVERDFWRNLPEHVTVHASRLRLGSAPATAIAQALDAAIDEGIPAAARQFAIVQPHVVVNGVTLVSSLRGNAYEAALGEDLARLAGAPVVSAMAATREQLHGLGARRVAAVSPYTDEANARVRKGLEDDGFEVTAFHGLGITDGFELCRVPPDEIVAFALEKLRGVPKDAVLCMSTAFRAVEALPRLRSRFDVPVVTSNDAALQACRRVLGLT